MKYWALGVVFVALMRCAEKALGYADRVADRVNLDALGRIVAALRQVEKVGKEGEGGRFQLRKAGYRRDGALKIVEEYLGGVRRRVVVHAFCFG